MRRKIFIATVPIIILAILSSVLLVWSSGVMPKISPGVKDSERFSNVLMEENMSAWFNGHIHSNHGKENTRVDKWGTTFIDAGSIYDAEALFGGERVAESLVMIFENGSKEVTVRSRNHSERDWNDLENKFSFELNYPFNYDKDNLAVWIFCDDQPETEEYWKGFENSIEDANEFIDADISLILGDTVYYGSEKEYEKFVKYLENSDLPLENFYALAGNHDFSRYMTGNLSNYDDYIVANTGTKEKIKYSLDMGNVEFLFLSDEKPGLSTNVTENSFEWWKEKLKNSPENVNQITLTHAPLVGTVTGSELDDYLTGKVLSFAIIGIIGILGIGIIISKEVS